MVTYKCECGAKYKLPETSVGKKAKCKHCGKVFTVPGEAAKKPAASDPDDLFAEISAAVERSKGAAATERPTIDPVAVALSGQSSTVTAAPIRTSAPVGPTVTGALAGYGNALLRALQFPFSINNIIIFVLLWFILTVKVTILPFAGCVGLIAILIISGWYCTFLFDVVGEAAANRDDLPKISFDQGIMDDIVIPLLSWVGSWIVVLLPAMVYMTVKAGQLIGDPQALNALLTVGPAALKDELAGGIMIFTVLLYGGLALWPMVILCVALGGFGTLMRLDLIVLTIIRTLPYYLLTAGIFLATEFASSLLQQHLLGGLLTARATGKLQFMNMMSTYFVWAALAEGIKMYFTIVALRAIGAYYYYFKDRFEWDWG